MTFFSVFIFCESRRRAGGGLRALYRLACSPPFAIPCPPSVQPLSLSLSLYQHPKHLIGAKTYDWCAPHLSMCPAASSAGSLPHSLTFNYSTVTPCAPIAAVTFLAPIWVLCSMAVVFQLRGQRL